MLKPPKPNIRPEGGEGAVCMVIKPTSGARAAQHATSGENEVDVVDGAVIDVAFV